MCLPSGLALPLDLKKYFPTQVRSPIHFLPIANREVANSINQYHQETFDCYNRRFSIFMNDCTPGMFILSYLLDPGASLDFSWFDVLTKHFPVYYRDGALRLVLPPRQNFTKATASLLVSYLITSARSMLKNEQKREQKGDAAEGDILVKQIICTSLIQCCIRADNRIAYMYREAPFNTPCSGLPMRLPWWKSLAKDSNAYVLAVRCSIYVMCHL